jgi:hypothetical protein
MNGQKLDEVDTLKYLGSIISKDGSSIKEIKIRLEMASAAMTQLNAIWKSNISFHVKFKLYKSLILSILVYGCESWTLTADMERRIQAFENK